MAQVDVAWSAQRREAELLQCALRGRPFDHSDTQITLLFSLPVPGLEPTLIVEAAQSPESNAGREAAAKARLCAAAQQLLDRAVRVIDVHRLASAAHASVGTVRKHWAHIAARLHLRIATRRERAAMPRGGARVFARMVLLRRGRWVPQRTDQQPLEARVSADATADETTPVMCDQARKRSLVTRLIGRATAFRRPRRRSGRGHRSPERPPGRSPPRTAPPPRPPPADP